MTSPRTPRQWTEDDTIPDDVEQVRDVHGRIWSQQWLRMDDGSTQWRLPGTRFGSSTESVTRAFGPVSEVLPETPEPPQDWQPKPGERVIGKLFSHPDDDIEGEFVGHRDDLVSNLNVGAALWCAVLRATLRPAASQSVPAVPVSSTGGKETGEAAEDATEALGGDTEWVLSDSKTELAKTIAETASIPQWQAALTAALLLDEGWRPPLPPAQVEIDDTADAWYIRVLDVDVHHTTESAPVNLDWTRDGQLIGVELLGPLKRPSSPLPNSETEPCPNGECNQGMCGGISDPAGPCGGCCGCLSGCLDAHGEETS